MSIVFLLFFLKNCNCFNFIITLFCALFRLPSGFFSLPVLAMGFPSSRLRIGPLSSVIGLCPPSAVLRCSVCSDSLPAAARQGTPNGDTDPTDPGLITPFRRKKHKKGHFKKSQKSKKEFTANYRKYFCKAVDNY